MKTIEQAIAFAQEHESAWDRDASGNFGVHLNDPPPWNRLYGPIHSRGPVSGVILQQGKQVAAWGEPDRADLTFSVAKMYLALLAGVAYDRGLLPSVDERIGERLTGIGFDEGHNARITWRHMLQQTSEWQGTLWDIPDQADHYRAVTFGDAPAGRKGDPRPLQKPGSYWEYNDVRINQLAFALLHLFQEPLPDVFRDAIMRPVGASDDWQWVGYDNSWVEIDGRQMQSVTGGTHWGGGMSVSAQDQAKVGQMMLDDGVANGKRVLSSDWIAQMRAPSDLAPYYGYLIWLNHQRKIFPSLPESSYFGIGAGSSFTWIEPERELVVIVRWLQPEYADGLFRRILEALGDNV